MKKKLIFCILAMVIGSLSLQHCTPENDYDPCSKQQISYNYLTESEKQCIVYKQGDEVTFLSNLGDTVILIAQALENQFELEEVGSKADICPSDQLMHQVNAIELTSSNAQLFPRLRQEIYKQDLTQGGFKNGLTEFVLGRYAYKMETPSFNYSNYDSIIQIGDTSLKIITLDESKGKGELLLYINRSEGVVKVDLNGRTWQKLLK